MAEGRTGEDNRKKTGSFLKELLGGSMVTEKIILKNLWYVLLITLLAAIYIGNRFHAENMFTVWTPEFHAYLWIHVFQF